MAPGLSADKRLKVNVEIGRLKKQLRQIPIHTNDPHLHYHNLAIYESNVANTFNSIVNLLNNLLFNVGKREKQPAPAEDHL